MAPAVVAPVQPLCSDRFAEGLVGRLLSAPKTLDNQYAVTYPEEGDIDGAALRQRNLRRYLDTHRAARALLVSQAPGHMGTRWSGIPLADTESVAEGKLGDGYEYSLRRREPSCQTVLEGLGERWHDTLIWSVVPWHPAGSRLDSNRKPDREEIAAGIVVLRYVLEKANFRGLAALGEIASAALRDLGMEHELLPHPFYDGHEACVAALRGWTRSILADGD